MKKITILASLMVTILAFAIINEKITFARLTSNSDSRDAWCVGVSGTEVCVDASGNFIPTTTNSVDLGTSSLKFKNVYVSGTIAGAAVTGTTLTLTGKLVPAAKTIAELGAITPGAKGEIYTVSNGTMIVCVSSGTGRGAFSSPISSTTACS